MKIKICGMRDANNIKVIDALNPDYLGFIFYEKSPRFVSEEIELPETNAEKVGVFVNQPMSFIIHMVQKYNLLNIQLHGDESVETCNLLSDLGYDVIKAFQIDDDTKVEEIMTYKESCKYFLFDTKTKNYGGSGKKFNWDKLNELDFIAEYFLSGGIGSNDANEFKNIKLKNLIGIDLNSKFELKPGLKNKSLLREFLVNIKNHQ
ncbi:MAG: phosphoribosylanthranilate isomerase [Salinivirgaceae bacterium]|nr:phosphoribosylanthranilate isomerase [Salinivirgaceae bacterium]